MSMCTASMCTCKVACGTLHSKSSRGIHPHLTASSLVLGAVAGREGKGLTGRGDVQLDGAVAALRRAAVALQPPELVVCEERAEDGRNASAGLCTCKDAWDTLSMLRFYCSWRHLVHSIQAWPHNDDRYFAPRE